MGRLLGGMRSSLPAIGPQTAPVRMRSARAIWRAGGLRAFIDPARLSSYNKSGGRLRTYALVGSRIAMAHQHRLAVTGGQENKDHERTAVISAERQMRRAWSVLLACILSFTVA